MLIVSFVRSDDMAKGRRIEIEYQNGLWCAKASKSGLPPAPTGGF
jgi:ketopantoate reductase